MIPAITNGSMSYLASVAINYCRLLRKDNSPDYYQHLNLSAREFGFYPDSFKDMVEANVEPLKFGYTRGQR
jgi:hypothetical protein